MERTFDDSGEDDSIRRPLLGEGIDSTAATLLPDDLNSGSAIGSLESRTVGRFAILRRIGEGGMGVVYSAYDEELVRRVALQLLLRDDGDGISRARILREAQAMAQLSHPNVVQIYDVGDFEGKLFVAMEYIRGDTLKAWRARVSPDWHDVLAVHLQAGRGLWAAHRAGVVHRDYKPDNVLVATEAAPSGVRETRARVLDFGLAAPAGAAISSPKGDLDGRASRKIQIEEVSLTRTGALVGTPAYMSPEQFTGEPADARSDQFSFCVTLWEALYGERPFRGGNITLLASAVLDGEIQPPPANSDVPSWVREVLHRGLRVNPLERWESMADLLTALDRDRESDHSVSRRQRVRFFIMLGLVATVVLTSIVFAEDRGVYEFNPRDQLLITAFVTAVMIAGAYVGRRALFKNRFNRHVLGMVGASQVGFLLNAGLSHVHGLPVELGSLMNLLILGAATAVGGLTIARWLGWLAFLCLVGFGLGLALPAHALALYSLTVTACCFVAVGFWREEGNKS